jgi:hypothetical protein
LSPREGDDIEPRIAELAQFRRLLFYASLYHPRRAVV